MKGLGYGDGYIYAHDTEDGIGEMSCLPDSLKGTDYFQPGARGFETELAARMEQIREWHTRRQARTRKTATNKEPDTGDKE